MKATNTPLKWLAVAGIAGLAAQANAASSLTPATTLDLASSNAPASATSFKISVEGAYQGYKGTAVDISNNLVNVNNTFNGSVVAYRFWNNPTGTTFGTLAQGGGIINDLSTTDASFQNQTFANIWETTASNGSAFDTTQDFAGNIGNLDLGATVSVDITGMSAGSVYLFYGAYRSTASISANMTGSGTAGNLNIAEVHNGDFANNNEYYVARVDFTNDEGYTSFDYTMAASFNGRLSGAVVTVVPEPSSAALLGLGALGLLVRRRR